MGFRSQLKICNEVIHPGEFVSLALPLPELYSCLPAYMPIKVLNGKKPGPTLIVFAALNGDELNGTAIINRLLGFKKLKKLAGTLIAIPVVNVFGLANRSKFLPGNVLLSENFPGSKTGTHADRIADLFIREIFSLADFALSLETGPLNHSYLPEVSADCKHEAGKNAALSFKAPIITQSENTLGTLSKYALDVDKKLLTYTAGESLRLDSKAISIGVKGILNLMAHLEMIPDTELKAPKSPKTIFLKDVHWIRTSFSGMASNKVKLGSHVKKNAELATIIDPFAGSFSHKILSPNDGIIVGINNIPLVKEGEALFKLASLPSAETQSAHLKQWDEFVQS